MPSVIRRNKLILKSENGLFITSAGVFDPGEGEIRARLYIIPASLFAIRIQRRLPFFSGEKFVFFFFAVVSTESVLNAMYPKI